MLRQHLAVASVGALVLGGCGTIDPKPECSSSRGGAYLPLVAQAEWSYSVADVARDVQLDPKRNTIIEVHGSTIKLQVEGATRPAIRWLTSDGTRYEWLRNVYFDPISRQPVSDQYYDPAALRFDANQTKLGSWSETPYTKTSIDLSLCPDWNQDDDRANLDRCPAEAIKTEEVSETWTVIAVDDPVSEVQRKLEPDRPVDAIVAGDVRVLCQERRCAEGTCINGVYCFAPGIGKVYELSTEREELTAVCFPPAGGR